MPELPPGARESVDPSFRGRIKGFAAQWLPEGSRQRDFAQLARLVAHDVGDLGQKASRHWGVWGVRDIPAPPYVIWARIRTLSHRDAIKQRVLSATASEPVVVHYLIRDGGDDAALQTTMRSLNRQTWAHWRTTVVTDNSVAALVGRAAESATDRELVVFLEAGDRLEPDASFEVADAAWRNPFVEFVYWDDDVGDGRGRGRGRDPQFRPSWSPETLLSANYIGRSFAVRGRRLRELASATWTTGDDAIWWDLILRLDLSGDRVARVPKVLAHLLRRPTPTPHDGVSVVGAYLSKRGIAASAATDGDVVRIEWSDGPWPHVTIIVPSRHNRPLLTRCLESVARSDYPSFDVVVVDNGERTEANQRWYADTFPGLDVAVQWWDRPFNYSAVNNSAAFGARGDAVVFLNDDTEVIEHRWLYELVGWARQPEIGVVGLQLLDAEGAIQHGGVILGMNGYADHLFQGMRPGSRSLIGSTDWYRNVLAVTGACLAIRRDLFEELGGFDERFHLCGSDVVLGLDAVLAGKRNLCSAGAEVRHLESATRGTQVPTEDFFTSYWRYQRWVNAGDPYFSPNLSLARREPHLAHLFERTPQERIADPLGRQVKVFRMRQSADEGRIMAGKFRATDALAEAVAETHRARVGSHAPESVTWFLPDIDSPFYGGVSTALRIADHLARTHGVDNRFAFWSDPNDLFFRSAIAAAFPSLAEAPIFFHDSSPDELAVIPPTDAAIATLWATAFSVAQHPHAARKYYLIQDFEPMFYPAGTMYALAEESYRLNLYGICNTAHMLELYDTRYGGKGTTFTPAVDPAVFHAKGRRASRNDHEPATVFVYARPGHWRNCWELASVALGDLKRRLGDEVRIVTAGAWARGEELGDGIEHLGLLDYRETGELYRSCDVGVALTVSEHPSYLPLELMACGVPVVAFDNPAGHWLLRDGENSLLVRRSADALSGALERIVGDDQLRRGLATQGLHDIAEAHGSWDKALSGIYEYLTDPEGS